MTTREQATRDADDAIANICAVLEHSERTSSLDTGDAIDALRLALDTIRALRDEVS